jgi:hypothetical protein
MNVRSMVSLQNHDGGWPYRTGGGSWTEPTVLALLALSVEQGDPQSISRGLSWLRTAQRPDGGWPPRPSVVESTWVTALVALLPRDSMGVPHHAAAIAWLMAQTGEETSFAHRLRVELSGAASTEPAPLTGWPFIPGAAAWTTPTAMSILALEKARRYETGPRIGQRAETGRQFLLDRMCKDGGWNYGRANVLGVDADSYPETTGQALLALHQARSPKLGKALEAAQAQARSCRSAEGLSWLQLGLQAHGVGATGPSTELPCRHVADAALRILAEAAEGGRNVFLE